MVRIKPYPGSIRTCIELGRVDGMPLTQIFEDKIEIFLHGSFFLLTRFRESIAEPWQRKYA